MFHGRSPISAQRSCRTIQRHQAKSSWQKWKCTTLKSPTSGANFWLVIKHQWIEKLKNYQKLLSLLHSFKKKISLISGPFHKSKPVKFHTSVTLARPRYLCCMTVRSTWLFPPSIRRRKKNGREVFQIPFLFGHFMKSWLVFAKRPIASPELWSHLTKIISSGKRCL